MTRAITPDIPAAGVAATAGWVTVTVPYRAGRHAPIPGEPTPVTGLVIVPTRAVVTAEYTGRWSLVHARSGLALPGVTAVPLVYAREAAAHLATIGADWTRTADQVRADPAIKKAVGDVLMELFHAWDEGRPLWWARPSWREDDRLFGIVCAAPLCDHHHTEAGRPAALTGYDDYIDAHVEAWWTEQANAARAAERDGWRRHDEHWLCRACAADHTPNTDPDTGC